MLSVTQLVDPRTGTVRGEAPRGDEGEVTAAVAAARRALPGWAGQVPAHRARRLLALADLVESSAESYGRAELAGTGKPRDEAMLEIAASAEVLRFYAGAVRAELTPASGERLPGRESWVRWEPLGVVAAIVPWNYPLLMAAWRIGPALAAGNTVVLKPAETTPDSALLLAAHAAETLGPGVLTALPGDRDTGRLLVGSAVDAVAFTGSQAGGLDVVARAGLRRVSLELGGNCPVVVLPGAPEYSYDAIVAACVYNAGQSCAAPARVITLAENHDETVERLAEAMSARRAGIDFGPLNNAGQLARFDRVIDSSTARVRHVAKVEVADGEAGGFWRPGQILADVEEDDPAVVEEVFGPVLTVQAAAGVADAVRLANSSELALAASVWGGQAGEAMAVATRLDAGEVWINCHLEQTAELPHGGRRRSGHGTDLSVLALTEYQRPKTITLRYE
ncbi:aldehyde dehydrogenase family protein [Nonomuraea sp. B5E05]|uniref:aldehyde dehydrogenase family protein n=1 Tax=Nonomuraea sp. B5E05 TaxID=3153569 RepID=UPI00326085D7